MFEIFETHPQLNVQEAEYQRLLGFPKSYSLTGRMRELVEATRQWYAENGRPWFYAREMDPLELTRGKFRLGGTEFASKPLHNLFVEAQANSAVLVAVSAGPECEARAQQLWRASKPDEYFFMEMFGSAVVEHLVTVASGHICRWADHQGAAALPHYSPGYTGWDISEQIKLWHLIRESGERHFGGRLDVLETGMLCPKKSLLAVLGLTRNLEKARSFARLVPCEDCSLLNCQYRRAPYRRPPQQIEDVHAMLSRALDDFGSRNRDSILNAGAKYTTNPRALEKWSRERLQLEFSGDGGVEARFRYEGTTCLNMGRALEFDFRVRLAPPRDQYRIVEMNCTPAPDDDGHQYQCEYLVNAATLMRSLADEKPLLGRSLNEVLTWKREYNPSGCFCDSTRREHKWGLVLEVIHFALAQQERGILHGQAKTILK